MSDIAIRCEGLKFWMFATPVAYPSTLLHEPWRTIYGLNPMVGVIVRIPLGVVRNPDGSGSDYLCIVTGGNFDFVVRGILFSPHGKNVRRLRLR